MDETRRDALRDLIALLTLVCFVTGPGVGLFLLAFRTFAPALLGPLDRPMNPLLVLPFFLAFVVIFAAGAVLGGTGWVVVMSRFLPRHTIFRWLTYGPQLEPLLSFNLRLLDRVCRR